MNFQNLMKNIVSKSTKHTSTFLSDPTLLTCESAFSHPFFQVHIIWISWISWITMDQVNISRNRSKENSSRRHPLDSLEPLVCTSTCETAPGSKGIPGSTRETRAIGLDGELPGSDLH